MSYKMKIAIFAIIMIAASPALACGGDAYDREQELKIIRNGLERSQSSASDKQKITELLDKAAVQPGSLTIRGIRLQSEYRGSALRMLGLNRIPTAPSREFAAIDEALKSQLHEDNERKMAQSLRTKAETLWGAGSHGEARLLIRQAMAVLKVKVVYPRC